MSKTNKDLTFKNSNMKKVIKIQYRKQNEKETAPWQQLNNIDEIVWDGRYDVRVENYDTSINLPFAMNENETATLIVEDYSHSGKLQPCRTTVQRISKIDQQSGELQTYYRTYYKTDGRHQWSEWDNGAKIGINENAITWNDSSRIDTYTTAGVYNISGERTNATDGLPIANAAPGHSFHARLVVLDSSIPGNGQSDDKCITQMLMLSNRTGGDGDVYVRTGRAANKNQLAGGNGWEPWGKLQQNIEVGQTTSLDDYIDNGIYSGIYTNGTTLFETFVMVVINNYAVAGATGKVRSISQFKYALGTDSTFSHKTRTGQGNTGISWGEWVDLGAATTADIQDNSITAQKLSADVREKVEKTTSLEHNATKEKTALLNGDTIVGLAREVYSRQGKTDVATFLHRTTAGGTSISDGVATLKQVGGNMVKNLVDGTFASGWSGNYTIVNDIVTTQSDLSCNIHTLPTHKYYVSAVVWSNSNGSITMGSASASSVANQWVNVSLISTDGSSLVLAPSLKIASLLVTDITEMFGTNNEPTKDECDKMLGTMNALPQGLTVANPTELKSTGYNQWNPANVFTSKSIANNAIVDGDESIAFIECLPCKVGAGENNGYVIGYGEGEEWSDEGIEVYLTPLDPMSVTGELYMHKLEKDATTGTYVPQIKGYLLVVTSVTEKLCIHFNWSCDRAMTDYEPYVESIISLPDIPQMSEWGLAGISTSGTMVQDVIDLENMVYTKRIGRIDLGTCNWTYYPADATHPHGFFVTSIANARLVNAKNLITDGCYNVSGAFTYDMSILGNATGAGNTLYLINSSISDASLLKDSLRGICLYYQINDEEYPIVSRIAPNYIGSDYGTECFVCSKVPLAANILFYMRSLVSETRNFLDRLMAGLGVSDVTTAADRIIATIMPGTTPETELEIE